MRRRLANWLRWVEAIALFGVAFAVVVGFLVYFKLWGEEWKWYFWVVGDYEMLLYLFVGLFVIAFILKKLLIWEVRAVFR